MKIDSYSFGKIIVDGVVYTRDLKIFPDKIVSNWWRKEGHLLQQEDMEDVFLFKPEVVVVGKGMFGVMEISPGVKERLTKMGVDLLEEKTGMAVEIFNRIFPARITVGLFHLTC